MAAVFISYRRSDASASAGRLCDWLKRQFGEDRIFLDTEKIAGGDAFPRVLAERLASCESLVAVIGPAWITLADEAGNRRIADPKDFVAMELGTAMQRGLRVIPVLVGGASMPSAGDLPPALRDLAERNAVAIDDSRFRQDFDNLVDAILGRPRGFARRELDRLQRGARVLKASSFITPVVAIVALFAAWVGLFDAFLLDTRVASYSMWLGEHFVAAPGQAPVALIAIDAESEKRLGRKYGRTPEWRVDHATLIDRLAAAGVKTIAFDLFIEGENAAEVAADAALADAIRRATQKGVRVIFGVRAFADKAPALLPALADAGALAGSICMETKVGYAFTAPLAVSPDPRGKRDLRAMNPALGLLAAVPGRPEAIDEERREIRMRDDASDRFARYSVLDDEDEISPKKCPTLGEGHVVATLLLKLSPSGYWRTAERRISYSQVLAQPSSVEQLNGKVALIGVALDDGSDTHHVIRGLTSEERYGVELHADTIANLQGGIAVRPLGPTTQWILMLLLAAAGAMASFLLFDRTARERSIALGLALLVYAAAAIACYLALDILLNMLYDIASFAVAYALLGRMQRKALAGPVEEIAP